MLYGVQCKIYEELEVQSSISNVLSEIYNTIRITNKTLRHLRIIIKYLMIK